MRRFWAVQIQPGLWGDVAVLRRWGRIGAGGQERRYWFAEISEASHDREKIIATKRRRGYAAAE